MDNKIEGEISSYENQGKSDGLAFVDMGIEDPHQREHKFDFTVTIKKGEM